MIHGDRSRELYKRVKYPVSLGGTGFFRNKLPRIGHNSHNVYDLNSHNNSVGGPAANEDFRRKIWKSKK